ncbi:ribonuclease P protein component [Rhodococcus fascians]|uniref:ribonuclease P protein component n=1 Tax=Nocardiaceae TaxID=85025 RepID=UPI0019CFFABA|nr:MULTISPECIES: ribonuclease P protein component [Rhodococcus]MBW4779934.1 ribonuclease P protein component [Rhodococcus fascians]MDJ0002290.1 ribonuclease P protein component [Rhodococcus fascians]
MLPEPNRLHRARDFTVVMRRGRRMGRSDLVVHAVARHEQGIASTVHRPRFGLIVSKAVGPAVTRHRVARRLRHICAEVIDGLAVNTDVVIRALPGAAHASSADLHVQLRSGLKKLGLLEAPKGPPS